ncbi:unnamed protein product [Blepharisma stoltei]|uniref:Ion transport domain-containing protein n=1 Tax=Blepharisma stoltei TaxID=1481888 RepID=A0AAU9K920_9CILI|nr:unnamed protein product [Blepharisma stoltei]
MYRETSNSYFTLKRMNPTSAAPDKFSHAKSIILHDLLGKSIAGDIRDELTEIIKNCSETLPVPVRIPFIGNSLAISPIDGNFVFGSKTSRIAICSKTEIIKDKRLSNSDNEGITSIILQKNGKYIFTACKGGMIQKFLYANLELIGTLYGHDKQVNDIKLIPDEKYLISGSQDCTVRSWELFTKEKSVQGRVLFTSPGIIMTLDISPSGEYIAAGDRSFQITIFSIINNSQSAIIKSTSEIGCVKFSPSMRWLAVGDFESNITLYRFGSWDPERTFTGHSDKIRDLLFTFEEEVLISGSKDSTIRVWSLNSYRNEIVLSGHDKSVRSLVLSKDQQFIHSLGKDTNILTWKIPEFDDNAKCRAHTQTIWKLLISKKNQIFSNSDDGRVIIWDANTGLKIQELDHFDGLFAMALTYDESQLISCTDGGLMIFWNLTTYQRDKEIVTEGVVKTLLAVPDTNILVTGDSDFRVVVWNLMDNSKLQTFRAHKSEVWSLAYYDPYKMLFSGDDSGTIIVHDINSNIFLHEMIGHTDRIQALEISRDGENLISGCRDHSIRIWSVNKNNCLHIINFHTDVVRHIHCTQNGLYFMACSEDHLISLWDMKNYSMISTFKLKEGIIGMAVSPDESYIVASENCDFTIMPNPLTVNYFSVYGPSGEKYKFMKYISKIMLAEYVEHDPEMDKWIIMPYFLNTLHLYSYFNMSEHLRLAVAKNGPFYPSRNGPTPLSIAIEKNFFECISAIFKVIDKMAINNMFCFYYLERSLIDLNYKGFTGLDKFYRIALKRCTNAHLPKFCNESVKLPITVYSDFINPKAENFMSMDNYTKEGKAIMFLQTLVKFNLTIGSRDSLKFLDSLRLCSDIDSFETPLIQHILNEKWIRVSWVQDIEGGFYCVYLVLLAIYTIRYPGNKDAFYPPFIINSIQAAYGVYLIAVAGKYYWTIFWNYLDIIRILMTITYAVLLWNDFEYGMNEFLGILTFVSWARGTTFFRIFSRTRYLINLIREVFQDIFFFLVILFYSTIAFSLISYVLYSVPVNDDTYYFHSLTLAYEANIGDYDTSDYGKYYWLYFFAYTIINPLIMLNLIINLMGNTFDKVQEGKVIADSLELIEMLIEGETLLIWRRNYGTKHYIQICIEEKDLGVKRSPALKKIGAMKKQLINIQQYIDKCNDEENQKLTEIFDTLKRG